MVVDVGQLIHDRLATEPHAARLALTNAMYAAALRWVRATLEAVVDYGRTEEWSEQEIDNCIRGVVGRLVQDDLVYLAEEGRL